MDSRYEAFDGIIFSDVRIDGEVLSFSCLVDQSGRVDLSEKVNIEDQTTHL
jgi:hypothetical protein